MRASSSAWVVGFILLYGIWSVGSASTAAIYRCEIDGVPTFSDRPCSSNATRLAELEVPNTYEAPPVQASAVSQQKKPQSRSNPDLNEDAKKRAQACTRLAEQLKQIRSKYRSGYTAKEGERLQQRESKLKSQLRMAQCG